jgi:Protein of unknown function (DUF1653)
MKAYIVDFIQGGEQHRSEVYTVSEDMACRITRNAYSDITITNVYLKEEGILNVVVGRTYKNKKNGLLYEVRAIGSHTEREETIVYYVPLYPTITKWKHCFRPYDVFVEKFEWVEE